MTNPTSRESRQVQSEQPEAIQIANALELMPELIKATHLKAAAELRRLHLVNQELVEALKVAVRLNSFREFNDHIPAMKAAIAKAKGESNE